VEPPPAPRLTPLDPPRPQPRAEAERENRQSVLYLRKSVFDPDALFNRLEPRLRFLWTRAFVVASAALIVAAALVSWTNGRELLMDFPLAWAGRWEVLLLAWLTLVLSTT